MNTINACVPQAGGAVVGYKMFPGFALVQGSQYSWSLSGRYVQFLMADLAIHHNRTTITYTTVNREISSHSLRWRKSNVYYRKISPAFNFRVLAKVQRGNVSYGGKRIRENFLIYLLYILRKQKNGTMHMAVIVISVNKQNPHFQVAISTTNTGIAIQ